MLSNSNCFSFGFFGITRGLIFTRFFVYCGRFSPISFLLKYSIVALRTNLSATF